MTKGPCRHKETWWWNEEVAEAVREKKIKYGKWKKEKYERGKDEQTSRKNAKRVIYSAKEKKQKESANGLNDSECQKASQKATLDFAI